MSIFSKVGGLKPGLTAFNLSHTNLFDCNFGQQKYKAIESKKQD